MAAASLRRGLNLWMLLTALCSLVLAALPAAQSSVASQLASADGEVVRINGALFKSARAEVEAGALSLAVIFDAANQDQVERGAIDQLIQEFSRASKLYHRRRQKRGEDGIAPIYFCLMDWSDSSLTFQELDITSIPKLRFFSSATSSLGEDCNFSEIEASAEGLLGWLGRLTGTNLLPPQPLKALVKALAIPAIVLGALLVLAGAWHVLLITQSLLTTSPTALIGCTLAILIYIAACGGTMNVIINNLPFYIKVPERLILFYPGSQQLGAEGLIAGMMYTSAGLALACMTHVLPLFERGLLQRSIAFLCEGAMVGAVWGIAYLSTWKQSRGGGEE